MQFVYSIAVNALLKRNILSEIMIQNKSCLRWHEITHKNFFKKSNFYTEIWMFFKQKDFVMCIDQNGCFGWSLYELFCSKVSAFTIALAN